MIIGDSATMRDYRDPPIPGLVVLDTNVWLDCLVFDDREAKPLRAALGPRLQAVASPRMRAELQAVLGRAPIAAHQPAAETALADFDRLARLVAADAPVTPLRCSDPADQMFLDLACAVRARWLLSRDRALLKLARRADRLHGIAILTPAAFASAYHAG
jgi:putative PIN family toxin of toxin-antitoxin system